MLSRLLAAVLAVVLVTAAATPASATRCQTWRRMTDAQRWDRVYRMIDDAISGQGGREFRIDRGAVGRCMERQAEAMYWAFDDACLDSGSAGPQAIDQLFKRYIWSCIQS